LANLFFDITYNLLIMRLPASKVMQFMDIDAKLLTLYSFPVVD